MYFTMMNEARRWDASWNEMFSDRPSLRHALLADVGAVDAIMVQQIILYTGSEYADLLTNSTFWADPELGRQLITEEREYLTNAVELVKVTDLTELKAARKQGRQIVHWVVGSDHEIAMESGQMLFLILYSIGALVSLFSVISIGQPPLLRLMGLAVVNRHGRPASRGRVIARWAAGWLSVLAMIAGIAFLIEQPGPSAAGRFKILSFFVFLSGCALVHLYERPWQAWFERITGTYVVPR